MLSTLWGSSLAFRRANTLRTCSLLSAPDSMTQFHRLQAVSRYTVEYLRHGFVAPVVTHQPLAQAQQRWRHIGKGSPVSQGARLALYQRDVVLPVVADVALP